MVVSENAENIRNFRDMRIEQLVSRGKGSSQHHPESPESSDILRKDDPDEETLHAVISEIWNIFEASKRDPKRDKLAYEVKLRAESLRNRKRRRAALLSVMRAGSTLMLFLSFGLLQSDFSLYLFSIVIGCSVLGLSAFLERGA
jgi:hypothetical protein